MKLLIAILLVIPFISCSSKAFERGTLYEWSKKGVPDRVANLDTKGKNFVKGYRLIEKRENSNAEILLLEYYLKQPNGDSLKLDFNVRGSSELLYFEFYEHNLFVLINVADMVDRVQLYNFDVLTGKINFQTTGQLPCVSKFKFNWKIGNQDCEWLSFKDGKIALASMETPSIPKLAVYNWRLNKYDVLDTGLNIGLSSHTGFVVKGNVYYNSKNGDFGYRNKH